MVEKIKSYPFLLCILLLTVFIFSNAFKSQYVLWDDNIFIGDNPIFELEALSAIYTMFTQYFSGDYLPLTLLSFYVEILLFGKTPEVQHLFNVLIHISNITLLYLVFIKLCDLHSSDRKWLYFFTLATFAFHPLQTESVMWITERKGLLSCFFAFLAILSLNKTDLRFKSLFLFNVFYLFSLLSKANFIFLPIILLVFRSTNTDTRLKKIYKILPSFFIIIVFSIFRILAYESSGTEISKAFLTTNHVTQIPSYVLNALGFYFLKVLLPFNQSIIYSNLQYNFTNLFSILIGIILLFFLYFQVTKRKSFETCFFSSLFILPLIPVLQIIPRVNYLQDRYMYIPIIGLTFLVLNSIYKTKSYIFAIALPAFLVLFTTISTIRSRIWENSISLWEATTKESAWSALAHLNFGISLLENKELQRAAAEFNLAISLDNDNSVKTTAYNSLANVYLTNGPLFNPRHAEALYYKAISLDGPILDKTISRYNLAMLLIYLKDNQKAEEIINQIIKDSETHKNHAINFYAKKALTAKQELLKKN